VLACPDDDKSVAPSPAVSLTNLLCLCWCVGCCRQQRL
jgi:hypothetical protein